MARVEYAPLVDDVRGRFGGMVFSAWQGTRLIRRFTPPSNPSTPGQMAVRNAFRAANYFYQLPDGTGGGIFWRQGWARWAETRTAIPRNGFVAAMAEAVTVNSLGGVQAVPRSREATQVGLGSATVTVTYTGNSLSIQRDQTIAVPTGYDAAGTAALVFADYDPDDDFTPNLFRYSELPVDSSPTPVVIPGSVDVAIAAFAYALRDVGGVADFNTTITDEAEFTVHTSS